MVVTLGSSTPLSLEAKQEIASLLPEFYSSFVALFLKNYSTPVLAVAKVFIFMAVITPFLSLGQTEKNNFVKLFHESSNCSQSSKFKEGNQVWQESKNF